MKNNGKVAGFSFDVFHQTAEEMISDWDQECLVWSIEMGGLGPGYEQVIQVLCMELCREFQFIEDWSEENNILDIEIDERVSTVLNRYFSGVSAAQVGAASSLAVLFCSKGPRNTAKDIENQNRFIQISRSWIRAPRPGDPGIQEQEEPGDSDGEKIHQADEKGSGSETQGSA